MAVQNAAATLAGVATIVAATKVLAAAHTAVVAGATFGPAASVQHKAVTSFTGLAAFGPASSVQHEALAALAGHGTSGFTGLTNHKAGALFAGSSSVTASAVLDVTVLRGVAIFFIDPSKVTLIPFFKAVKPPAVTASAPRPAVQGPAPSNVTLGVRRTTPNSNTKGVPNEG